VPERKSETVANLKKELKSDYNMSNAKQEMRRKGEKDWCEREVTEGGEWAMLLSGRKEGSEEFKAATKGRKRTLPAAKQKFSKNLTENGREGGDQKGKTTFEFPPNPN